jgi:hypothetical protein
MNGQLPSHQPPQITNYYSLITSHQPLPPGSPMTRRTLEIAAFCAALLLAAMAAHAWLDSRDEQQRLAATLAAQKQLLDAADSRERTRQSALDATLAQIETLKRSTLTPEQVLRELPKYLPLPQPITLAPTANAKDSISAKQGTDAAATATPGQSARGLPTAPAAQIPSADLKPLYDYVQDCRACQAQLAAAKQNQADDAAKLAALTRERDAAVTAAKGGTFWRRLRRNAFWFGVGAALGAAASYTASKR